VKTLTKFKLLPLGLAVWYTEQHDGEEHTETVSREMPYPYKDSLSDALLNLRPHLMILTESVEGLGLKETQELMAADRYRVTGVTWGGSGDSAGVTLIGRRELRGNRVLNLVAPFTKFTDEFDEYAHANELYLAICDLEAEVLDYVEGTSRGQSSQFKIDFTLSEKPEAP